MSTGTAILSSILALAPPDTPPPAFDVSDVDSEQGDRSYHLNAYDADGEVSAELIAWGDADGVLHIDVVFPDGLYAMATIHGEDVTVDSPDPAEVAARAQAIGDFLRETGDLEKPWAPCALGIVGTVVGVVGANPWVLVTTYGMACSCLPLLIEEFEEIKCPGFE